jgi:hypothetical protein
MNVQEAMRDHLMIFVQKQLFSGTPAQQQLGACIRACRACNESIGLSIVFLYSL